MAEALAPDNLAVKRRHPVRGSISSALLCALLAACTVIGTERVQGWPQMQVIEHYVPHARMRDKCAQYVGFGESPMACAEFDFAAKRCDIWYSADFPPQDFIKDHERKHCLGYEHAGEHEMAAMLRNYLAGRKD